MIGRVIKIRFIFSDHHETICMIRSSFEMFDPTVTIHSYISQTQDFINAYVINSQTARPYLIAS